MENKKRATLKMNTLNLIKIKLVLEIIISFILAGLLGAGAAILVK